MLSKTGVHDSRTIAYRLGFGFVDGRGMTRWRAAGLHLLASTTVGLITAALIVGLWYPGIYFDASGASRLILILLGVDVMLGPLLTLIVFRHDKPEIAFDMAVILIVQLAAFTYGLTVIVSSRPVFLVAAVDRLVVVSANQLDQEELPDDASSPYRRLSFTGPELVGLQLPSDLKERNRVLTLELAGRPAEAMPRLYRPYSEVSAELIRHGQPISQLLGRPDEESRRVVEWLAHSGRKPDELVWVPLQARKRDLVTIIDRESAVPLVMLDIHPW